MEWAHDGCRMRSIWFVVLESFSSSPMKWADETRTLPDAPFSKYPPSMPRTGFGHLDHFGCLLLLVLFVGGCTSKPIKGDPLSLEAPRPAHAEFTLSEVFPWTAGERAKPTDLEIELSDGVWTTRFEVLEGPATGGVMIQTRRAAPEPGAWTLTRQFENQENAQEERHLRLDESGSLIMSEMLNFERGVRVEMEPPGLAVPSRLEPGGTVERASKLRLPLIDNPKRLREKGTGRAEIAYLDEQRVQTRAGVFDAMHLQEVFTSRFSAASAVRTIDRWYAPGNSLVAERWVEEVTVLGVVIERSRQAIRALPPVDNGR